MAIKITQQEAAILSQMSYMNISIQDYDKKTLQEMASELIRQRDEAGIFRDFGSWGAFTNYEQYQLLEDIANGKYENLSKLRIVDYENQQGTTDFVAYAFSDGTNTICAFRGTMGTQVGHDGAAATIRGFLGPSWLDNGYLGTHGASLHFAPVKAFVERNMQGGEVFVTGHSKGCADAAYACAAIPGVTGFGFDGPGIGQALTPEQWKRLANSGFINCVNQDDVVGALLQHPEQRIYAKQCPFNILREDGTIEIDSGQVRLASHYLQAFGFEGGTVIPGERTLLSKYIESETQGLYSANQLTGDNLGRLIDVIQLSKGNAPAVVNIHREEDRRNTETFQQSVVETVHTGSRILHTAGDAAHRGAQTVYRGMHTAENWFEDNVYQPAAQGIQAMRQKAGAQANKLFHPTVEVTVLPGDDMEKIARAFKTTTDKITDEAGQVVTSCAPYTVVHVPACPDVTGSIAYFAQPGDDWNIISARTGVPNDMLRARNPWIGDIFNPDTEIALLNPFGKNVTFAGYPESANRAADSQSVADRSISAATPFASDFAPRQSEPTIIKVKILERDGLDKIAAAFDTTPDKITFDNGEQVYACEKNTWVNVEVHLDTDGKVLYRAMPDDDWGKISERTGVNYDELRAGNPGLGEGFDKYTLIRYSSPPHLSKALASETQYFTDKLNFHCQMLDQLNQPPQHEVRLTGSLGISR